MSQTNKGKPKRVRQYYDAQFKRAAVEHYHQNGCNLSGTAQALSINHWTLRDWIEKEREGSTGLKALAPGDLAAENRRLRQELAEVKEQRDILKKSLGILSTT